MACIFYEMPYAFFEGAKRGVFAGLMMPFLPFGNFFSRTILLPCNISWRWRAMCS